jgi:hypothetical protein
MATQKVTAVVSLGTQMTEPTSAEFVEGQNLTCDLDGEG